MARMAIVSARVESGLKQEAEAMLLELGMSVDEAITLFYERLTAGCSEPFSPHIPNAETIEAMKEGDNRENLPKYSSFGEFLATLE